MKFFRNLLSFGAVALGLLAWVSPARAQTTAVNAITFGNSGTVDTTWLGNAAASGTYTFVYKANGTAGTQTAQSGTLPAGITISKSVSGSSTTFTLLSTLNNTHYIRKRVQSYVSGGTSTWSENIYAGPPVNAAPSAVLSLKVGGVEVTRAAKGDLIVVGGTVTDDGDLTDVNLRELSPLSSPAWVDGTTAAGTRWTGSGGGGGAGVTIGKTFVGMNTGAWSYRLQATDTRPENAVVVERALTIADRPFHDVGNSYNGVVPSFNFVSGTPALGAAGSTARQSMTLEVRDAQGQLLGAGKSVRVTLSPSGGWLFSTATGGSAAGELVLTTAANGTATFYWQPGVVAATKATFLVQGGPSLMTHEVLLGAAGTSDGFSAAMKTALGITGAYTVVDPTTVPVQTFRP